MFDKPYALWNFGYGLSYTDFEYSDFSLNDTVFSANGKLKAKVKVKNTGKRDGKEVVQLYVHDLVASVSQPVQQLKAFKKVEVPAGKEVEVELEMPMEELSFCNEYLKRVVEPGDVEIQIGRASDNIVFRKTIVGGIDFFSGRFSFGRSGLKHFSIFCAVILAASVFFLLSLCP